jgi:hypothetical protein
MSEIEWNDETKMAWLRANVDPAEKSVCLAISREYVQERYRDAGPVYRYNKRGEATHIAIGLAHPVVDEFGEPARKQRPVQLLTPWYRWEDDFSLPQKLAVEWELWADAYGAVKHRFRKTAPEYDALTQHTIQQQEQANG